MDSLDLLRTAKKAAEAAVVIHRARLGQVPVEEWAEKGVADFVSDVDREAEAAIVDRIQAAYPGHSILAEESATAGGSAEPTTTRRNGYLWIIDPLDGTTNYLHRYPMYAASVAVAHDGELIAGVVASAPSNEVWMAARGHGATRNGERIRVSSITSMKQALIGTGFPFKHPARIPEYLGQFDRVMRRTAGVRRAGAAAVDLCHVAMGVFDGFWELILAPWDVAAGALIVREAGGIVARLDGSTDVIGATGSVLAGNAAVHAALREIVKGDTR